MLMAGSSSSVCPSCARAARPLGWGNVRTRNDILSTGITMLVATMIAATTAVPHTLLADDRPRLHHRQRRHWHGCHAGIRSRLMRRRRAPGGDDAQPHWPPGGRHRGSFRGRDVPTKHLHRVWDGRLPRHERQTDHLCRCRRRLDGTTLLDTSALKPVANRASRRSST